MASPNTNQPFPGDDDPAVQAYRLRCVESDVKTILKKVEEINLKLATTPAPCPAPGLCVTLRPKVEEMQTLIERAKGAWWAVGLLSGGSGAGIVGLIWYALQHR